MTGSAGTTEMMTETDSKLNASPRQRHTEAAVAEFIRNKGITRCPTACVLPTQGEITPSDRAALAEHAARRERSRRARAAQRASLYWLTELGWADRE
jgi:hypothetical protein